MRQIRAEGFDVRGEDLTRPSPRGHEHVNMLGRNASALPETVAHGELRPLRDPPLAGDERDETALTQLLRSVAPQTPAPSVGISDAAFREWAAPAGSAGRSPCGFFCSRAAIAWRQCFTGLVRHIEDVAKMRSKKSCAIILAGLFAAIGSVAPSNLAQAQAAQTSPRVASTTSTGVAGEKFPTPVGFTAAYREVDGVVLHYVSGGSGPLVLLVHGFGQSWYEWHQLMPLLAKTHTVVAVDLPSYGRNWVMAL